MADVSDETRTFIAYFYCGRKGSDKHYVDQVIKAGEDADVIMAKVMSALCDSYTEGDYWESGYWEPTEKQLTNFKKDGRI